MSKTFRSRLLGSAKYITNVVPNALTDRSIYFYDLILPCNNVPIKIEYPCGEPAVDLEVLKAKSLHAFSEVYSIPYYSVLLDVGCQTAKPLSLT